MALNISSNIVASEKGRELVQHGSALFPIACYAEDTVQLFGGVALARRV